MERWDPDEAVALMDAERCTHMAGATPFLEGLLAAAERADTRLPGPQGVHLRRRVGAAVADPQGGSLFRARGGHPGLRLDRGAGDDRRRAHGRRRPRGRHRRSAGIADIKLVDTRRTAGTGEIRARGPQMLVGYLHPEDEPDSFDDDGYFRTGDLGRWVDDDYLVVTGRAKDIIIRNGENIAPKEIEDILVGHPGIAEIAIVGLPDARTGERACAVIVPAAQPGPDVAGLRDFLAGDGVAKFKVPEQVVIWDALPKNDAGKVLKHQIRATLTKADG